MGYTHYWKLKKKATEKQWNTLVERSKEAIASTGVRLGDWQGKGEAEFGKSVISFNGYGGNAYETFLLENKPFDFAFCKTGYRNYDVAVCIVLLVAKEVLKDKFEFASDGRYYGDLNKMEDGWRQAYLALGMEPYKMRLPFGEEE